MSLSLNYCSDADMLRMFTIMSEAFAGEPYINALFPHHGTPEGRVIGGKRLLEAKKADPAARFLKITDTATDEIVGLVKWLVFEKPPGEKSPEEPELTGDYWDTEEEKEYAAYMYKQYLIPRRKAIREAKGPLVALDLLTVDPKHQNRGAGTMLLQWGVDLGDELGAEMVVEGNFAARFLYGRFGYQIVEDITMTGPEKHANKPKQRYLWMRRPVTKKKVS